MRKWDGKPTATLEARVHELQEKTIAKGSSSRKIASPVSTGSSPDREGLILIKGLLICFYKKGVTNTITSTRAPCLQPGGGRGHLGILDSVDQMAWHVRPTGVSIRL